MHIFLIEAKGSWTFTLVHQCESVSHTIPITYSIYNKFIYFIIIIGVHTLAIRTKKDPSPPKRKRPLTRPSLESNKNMHAHWCEHTMIRPQEIPRSDTNHQNNSSPHSSPVQKCLWGMGVFASMHRVHTHTLTLMSGFISSPCRCPLRSADTRSGDGGNMAISWACKDKQQMFVCFKIWE